MDNASSPLRALRGTDFLPHAVAILVVLIWGVTFINSKVLLQHGMTPEEIFVVRFLLAYSCIWCISPRQLWCQSWRDELLMVLLLHHYYQLQYCQT